MNGEELRDVVVDSVKGQAVLGKAKFGGAFQVGQAGFGLDSLRFGCSFQASYLSLKDFCLQTKRLIPGSFPRIDFREATGKQDLEGSWVALSKRLLQVGGWRKQTVSEDSSHSLLAADKAALEGGKQVTALCWSKYYRSDTADCRRFQQLRQTLSVFESLADLWSSDSLLRLDRTPSISYLV